MGDSGANLLGYLLGVVAVVGSMKTGAVVALVVPLLILAVPFLDTGFVVAKRLKYRRKPWAADANHFHHRLARIGFSQRRTVAYLYALDAAAGGRRGRAAVRPLSTPIAMPLPPRLGSLMVAICVLALAASVYLVYMLEIFKFRGCGRPSCGRLDPEHERARDRRDGASATSRQANSRRVG